MKVDIKMNWAHLGKLKASQIEALKLTAEQLIHEAVTEQVIPFDEGTLQNISTSVNSKEANRGKVKIIHDTPYAQRLYYNPQYNFDHTINAKAQGEWWEDWLTGNRSKRPKQLYEKFFRDYSGGVIK